MINNVQLLSLAGAWNWVFCNTDKSARLPLCKFCHRGSWNIKNKTCESYKYLSQGLVIAAASSVGSYWYLKAWWGFNVHKKWMNITERSIENIYRHCSECRELIAIAKTNILWRDGWHSMSLYISAFNCDGLISLWIFQWSSFTLLPSPKTSIVSTDKNCMRSWFAVCKSSDFLSAVAPAGWTFLLSAESSDRMETRILQGNVERVKAAITSVQTNFSHGAKEHQF